ncbi:helix-turn-helix domain-containing protein [Oceanobacillus sp. CFH 90083]|uniref:helix-turn-helix domain-containing protein n=1 Tax=Oceanobacillus sp. CFH 90083 TaxID=2592336 RepID=UPI001D13E333|nr:helix-turn-helix domain-containing protein [Oceanobacillus sp. CFH 90083]
MDSRLRKRALETKEIIRLYQKDESTTEIAKIANVSPRYIRMLLKDNNVEMRPRGSWKRKYTLNEDYFKTWSNNMAYILVFFIADGTVARDAQFVSISQKEKYILEDIKNELDSNQPIYKNKNTGVYTLSINSETLKKDLIEIHSIKPNKSSIIEFPYVPKEYMSHFIRGYFDGDGFVKYEKFFVSFVGGSELFMHSLRNEIEKNGFETNFTEHGTYFRVYVSGRKTIKLFSEWIYKNKELYLKRKYRSFSKRTIAYRPIKR